jgi:ADP-heptose:LPS heptosyltransferase
MMIEQTQPIPAPWRDARRILAVRLDNLGDVIVTTPAIRAIRESLPEAEITLLASPSGTQAGRLSPDLADVLTYQAPWMDPWQQLPLDPMREAQALAAIRSRGFDAAVIFTAFRQSPLPAAFLCYQAGIPLRHGAYATGAGSLLTSNYRHDESSSATIRHEVMRGLDLVGALGLTNSDPFLRLHVPERARRSVADRGMRDVGKRMTAVGQKAQAAHAIGEMLPLIPHPSSFIPPLIVLHPGCTMPARTYAWRSFAQAADLLVERLGATVAITGSADERRLVEQVRGAMRHEVLALAGELSFPELCALIEAADVVVTNNTGPMHIAAAMQTPVVALFALTNPPEQWHPWRAPHRLLYHDVPCRICYSKVCPYQHECLALVTPEQVVDAAVELLGEGKRDEGSGMRDWATSAAPSSLLPHPSSLFDGGER